MATDDLKNKYRPTDFGGFYGNEITLEALQSAVQVGRIRAYLLSGPQGCGKTSIARVMAQYLGCDMTWGFVEINGGNDRGIDTIKNLNEKAGSLPLKGDCKVYFIDEAHRLTKDAEEALLKTLDEPPDHVYFILATTEPQKLLATFKSRVTHYQMSALKSHDMVRLLRDVCTEEGFDLHRSTIKKIVDAVEGIPRNALVLLEQIVTLTNEEDVDAIILQSTGGDVAVKDLCRALLDGRWDEVAPILKKLEGEPETIRRMVLGYMSNVLLDPNAFNPSQCAKVMNEFLTLNYYSGKSGLVFASYMSCL